jgi:hypothetical protein
MFSTTDAGMERHLHAFAIRPGIRREITVPMDLEDPEVRLLTLPSRSRMRRFARQLALLPSPDEGRLLAVELQIWSTRYDPVTLRPSSRLLRSIEVPVGPH